MKSRAPPKELEMQPSVNQVIPDRIEAARFDQRVALSH